LSNYVWGKLNPLWLGFSYTVFAATLDFCSVLQETIVSLKCVGILTQSLNLFNLKWII